MVAQWLIVGLVVVASFVYAGWTLMPAALRRRLATRLLTWPGLAGRAWLLRAARPANGCGCDGCDAGMPAPGAEPKAQRIMIVRRKTR
jgi:hypothetical protein